MSLPSGGRLDRGPHVGIPLDKFHSVISVLHTGRIYWECRPGFFVRFSSVTHFNLLATPRFNGVLLTAVNSASEASVLQQEVSSLLLKGAIEEVSSSRPGHPNPQVPGQLAYFSQLQGAGLLLHLRALGLRLNGQKSVFTPAQQTIFLGSLPGLHLDASPSGPCSGREHSVVCGPLQARSARISGPVSQAPRPHGGSFPGSSLGAAPYETIPLVDEVLGYLSLLAVPSPTKSVRCLFLRPFSVAGPQFSPEWSTYGGNLPSLNDNDGCFPLGVGSGFRGTTGLRCLVRQVPHLAHKRPEVKSGSSSSHSLSSIPDALTCHRQDGQHGCGVSHQSPGRLPVTHTEQACAPASSLGTGQVFAPESGSCPRGPEPSGWLLVKTETQESGQGQGNGCRTAVWWIRFGKDSAQQRWTSLLRIKFHLYSISSRMESVRPLIVPGPFLLGSHTPPNGGFLNPGVWLMLWTQLTARLVQCWSSYSISFGWSGLYHPESQRCSYRCSKGLGRCPLGRHRLVSSFMRGAKRLKFVLLVSLLGTFMWSWRGCKGVLLNLLCQLPWGFWHWRLHFCWHWPHSSVWEICRICLSASPEPSLLRVWLRRFLRPRPGYVPKVLSTSFCSQVVVLQAFSPSPSSEGDDLCLLCPVRALKIYVDRSSQWHQSLELLVWFDAGRKGLAASKHTISHWVRDANSLAYEVRSLPSPLDIRAHSTRGVASSTALFRGVPLEDICMAAEWSSPHTFVKFYNLDVNTAPGSQVLSAWTSCVFGVLVFNGPDLAAR